MHSRDEKMKRDFLNENPQYEAQARFENGRWIIEPPAYKEFLIWLAARGIIEWPLTLELRAEIDEAEHQRFHAWLEGGMND